MLETTPAFCDERIHLFLATSLHEGPRHPDAGEFVDVIRMPLEEAVDRILRGEIPDGKTQTAILKAYMFLNKKYRLFYILQILFLYFFSY